MIKPESIQFKIFSFIFFFFLSFHRNLYGNLIAELPDGVFAKITNVNWL